MSATYLQFAFVEVITVLTGLLATVSTEACFHAYQLYMHFLPHDIFLVVLLFQPLMVALQ